MVGFQRVARVAIQVSRHGARFLWADDQLRGSGGTFAYYFNCRNLHIRVENELVSHRSRSVCEMRLPLKLVSCLLVSNAFDASASGSFDSRLSGQPNTSQHLLHRVQLQCVVFFISCAELYELWWLQASEGRRIQPQPDAQGFWMVLEVTS